MKGCPEPKKLEFLKELKLFLRIQIANNAANAGYFQQFLLVLCGMQIVNCVCEFSQSEYNALGE